ncbi:MAG: hypothetical protein ABR587_10020 [Candidatus Binatia bacterium]
MKPFEPSHIASHRASVETSTRTLVMATVVSALLASGCTTMAGRPAVPLLSKRPEPGVVLCLSERTAGGGIRIIGKLNQGNFPITRATIETRTAPVSDPVPAAADDNGRTLVLSNPRPNKVNYRKGAGDVSFAIDGNTLRSLGDKVIWYRWIIAYDAGGTERVQITDIHRTSLEEAGLPRAPGSPGPDSSVSLPVTTRRR